MKRNFFVSFIFSIVNLIIIAACGFPSAQAQSNGLNFEWAKRIGGVQEDVFGGAKVDTYGNVFITGTFKGSVDFDPDTTLTFILNAVPNRVNKFFAKYDSLGKFLWVKNIIAKSNSYPFNISLDKYNNVYLSGPYSDSLDVDPGIGVNMLFTLIPYTFDLFCKI